ncbi:putative natural product biosynthesis protein [Pseudomonas kairouanensis]|uniref:Putative natural product biosynthesis protein n=1 Tax=Pseudomonas kairouanensis TaxID=2293832 RepID=A0A4Z0AUV0_9PSED|nr:putative natural product biosynthesis protein [Pseudomonas kairouanensis]TFY90592.1 putative natural product biosynthesis protein [Pseudomonas kairouanensis]
MNPVLPAGASRLVSKASRRLRAEPLRPDYPSNSRCFVHLDARLLPYWHTLFDICPALLKLDPPEGLNLFRSFMTWAYRNQPTPDWTYHLNVCRWLLGSTYRAQIDDEPIEAFMAAAAARWVNTDASSARGVVVAWQGLTVCDWKDATRVGVECLALPVPGWDFAWCPLGAQGPLREWLPVP